VVISVAALGGTLVACSSEQQASTTVMSGSSAPATSAPPTALPPDVPPGGVDCGSVNQLSGWPTTTGPTPDTYACIVDAMAAGRPARMVVVSPGQGSSGRTTADGYEIPARHVTTWVIVDHTTLEQTTDLTEDGGTVTTQRCTGLATAGPGSMPTGTACS